MYDIPLRNQRHELFVQEVFRGIPDEQAYVNAGYKISPINNSSNISRIRQKEDVIGRLEFLMNERRKVYEKGIQKAVAKTALNEAYVIENLMLVVDRSLGREPIFGPDPSRYHRKKPVYRYVPNAAVSALELLGKTMAMFVERAEIGRPGDFSALSTEELRLKVVDQFKKMQDILPPPKKGASS